jgi:HEAT repeat protein
MMNLLPKIAAIAVILVVSSAAPQLAAAQLNSNPADRLIRELRDLPAGLSPTGSDERRFAVYGQLHDLGQDALSAIVRGLRDTDVQIRRQVVLFLGFGAFSQSTRRIDFQGCQTCLSAVIAALKDSDSRVRELAAQAVGTFGPIGVQAVPALIDLLKYPDVGSRNTACIGLRILGPPAKDALPALRAALADTHPDVRTLARVAIEKIDLKP